MPWCMLFADGIFMIDETRGGLNAKLEPWRTVLDLEGVNLSQIIDGMRF